MNTINDIHAATRILDICGAPRKQYVFLSKEQFDNSWGKALIVCSPVCSIKYNNTTEDTINIIAHIDIDRYDFYFIDPQTVKILKP